MTMDLRIRQRRASVLRARRRRRSLLLFLPLLLGAVGATLYLAAQSSFVSISRVLVIGAPATLGRQIVQSLEPYMGKSTVFANRRAMVSSVEAVPLVSSAQLSVSLFGEVRVVVRPRTPWAAIQVTPHTWEVVDRNGVVIGNMSSAPSLPTVCEVSNPQSLGLPSCGPTGINFPLGARVSPSLLQGLAIVQGVKHAGLDQFSSVGVSASEGSFLLERAGNACKVGDSRAMKAKESLCSQLLTGLSPKVRYIADVSVPSLPTVQAIG